MRKQQGLTETGLKRQYSLAGYQWQHGVKDDVEESMHNRLFHPYDTEKESPYDGLGANPRTNTKWRSDAGKGHSETS